jgi:hypothetical protein
LNWSPAPLFAKKHLFLRVVSEDELIGSIVISCEDILKLPRDMFGTVVIAGELMDGSIVKGTVQIRCKIQPFDGDLLETKQFLKDRVQSGHKERKMSRMSAVSPSSKGSRGSRRLLSTKSLSIRSFLVKDDDEQENDEEEVSSFNKRPLSATTPTPIFTRVCVHEILLTELRAAHTIAKNAPVVSFHCGSYNAKTDAHEGAGSEAKWVNQSFAFTMRKMTYCKISVSSKGIFLGSTIVSTREVLECPKTPNGVTILKRPLENDTEITGHVHIFLRYGCQGEEIAVQKAGDKYTNPVSENVGSLNATNLSLISTDVHSMNFPVTVEVNKLHILDMMALHHITPNSPYAIVTCANWKVNTPVAHMAGSQAEWDDLKHSFVLYDDRAVFKVELRSGSVVAGKWSLSIGQIVATPRTKEGRIDISGYIKQGGSLIARVAVQVTILPFVTDESKSKLAASAADVPLYVPTLEGRSISPLGSPGATSHASPDRSIYSAVSLNQDNSLIGVLSIRVITAMDVSRLVGAVRAIASLDEWSQSSKVRTIRRLIVRDSIWSRAVFTDCRDSCGNGCYRSFGKPVAQY